MAEKVNASSKTNIFINKKRGHMPKKEKVKSDYPVATIEEINENVKIYYGNPEKMNILFLITKIQYLTYFKKEIINIGSSEDIIQDIFEKYLTGRRKWTQYPDRPFEKQIIMAIFGRLKNLYIAMKKKEEKEKDSLLDNTMDDKEDNNELIDEYNDDNYEDAELDFEYTDDKTYLEMMLKELGKNNNENSEVSEDSIKNVKINKYQTYMENDSYNIDMNEIFGSSEEEIHSFLYSFFINNKFTADVFIESIFNNYKNKQIAENNKVDIKEVENAKKRVNRAIKGPLRNHPTIKKMKENYNY